MARNASHIFGDLDAGIMSLIRAADLYTIHIIAHHRHMDNLPDLINDILWENRISSFTLIGDSYTDADIAMLDKTGYLRRIGEQIILATYTAAEVYLIEKFKEYYLHKASNLPQEFVLATLDRFSFRNLNEIKRHYSQVLDIHLPLFEIDYHSDPKSHFNPKESWTALNLIADVRNEIAHLGASKSYLVTTLMDSWYPFEFVRHWVAQFDINFDMMLYEGLEPSLIKQYKKRLASISKNPESQRGS